MKYLRQKILVTLIVSALLLSACSTPVVTEAPETTAATTEATAEATTEATTTATEETTEATTVPTYTDDMLPMTIYEVADKIAKIKGYERVSDKLVVFNENNRSIGIINAVLVGGSFGSSISSIYLCEFDMSSEEYKALSEDGEFNYYFENGGSMGQLTVAAINKQYVVYIDAIPYENDRTAGIEDWETDPPYTLGNAQEAYEAFIALE